MICFALLTKGALALKKEFNSKKYYRTLANLLGVMALIILTPVIVFRTELSIYVGLSVAMTVALFYIYVISGQRLKNRFELLGETKGKTPAEIVAVVGEADQICRNGDDITAMSWTLTNYRAELDFSDGTCNNSLRAN